MAGIKLPIEVGQKFLSDGLEVVIISVTGKVEQYPVIDDYGDRFGLDGQHEVHRRLNLQPSPVVITEGVEFSGEQYRAEFERLVADGREFEIEIPNTSRWVPSTAFESPLTYRLLPQHRDANNNPLKVGDRVRVDGVDGTITEFDGDVASTDRMTFGLRACRKLATRTRPLCAADLDKAPCPQFIYHGVRGFPAWCALYVSCNGWRFNYSRLVDECNWRPSSDQPWGPCEVEEEVLA